MSDEIDRKIANDIGKIALSHANVRRFLGDRFVMIVTPTRGKSRVEGDRYIMEMSMHHKIIYNSPTLIKRIKFFILDISIWLKEKIRNE